MQPLPLRLSPRLNEAAANQFDQIKKSSAGGANVVQQGIKLVAVAVSTARFESLEILRLRLWGKGVVSLPMEHKHFAFIQRVSR